MHPDRPPAPSIDLRPREPRLRARYGFQVPPTARYRCGCCDERISDDTRPRAVWLLVAFLLGVIGLSAYAWIDPVVRTALAVWEMAR